MNSVLITWKKLSSIWLCIIFLLSLSGIFFSVPVFAFEKTFTNSLGMEFVLIPSGTFTMGSPPDESHRDPSEVRHRVSISKPYYMQTTEVTLKQWHALMKRRFLISRNVSDHMPFTEASWFDCMKFIKRLNNMGEGKYRLPTEAEWEYAARAGTTTAYSWGDAIDCDKAMYGNNSQTYDVCQVYIKSIGLKVDQPAPVKTYRPNAWGLYDMHGNVWEWCMDWFGDYGKNSAVDPNGPDSGTMKIRRGGSWFKYGYSCRSANRSFGHPATRYQTTGFRVIKVIE
jgi:formylglycine-generating enzyme